MGLLVDKPKPGFGSTNDGNTARQFFLNAAGITSVIGVDKNLIERFNIMLQTLSSEHEIDLETFENYVSNTKSLYLHVVLNASHCT